VSPRRAKISSIPQSDSVNEHIQHRRHQHLVSRKEERRQGRAAQKQRKAEYFSHTPNARKRPAEEDHTESPQRKKHRQSNPENAPEVKHHVTPQQRKDKKAPPIHPTHKITSKPSEKPSQISALKKPSKSSSAPKTSPPREDPEDVYIAYLEAQLGLSKGGKKKAKEDDDGLDGMSWKILHLFPFQSLMISPVTRPHQLG
jgi:nucleolar MIF4G domain-containing protein 1